MKKQLLIAAMLAVASAAMAQPAPAPAPASAKDQAHMPPPGQMRGRTGPGGPMDEVAVAKRMQERFDINKDGKVTLQEFLTPATESFKKMDTNKDNAITPEELAAYNKKQREEFKARALASQAAAAAAQGGTPAPAPAPVKK